MKDRKPLPVYGDGRNIRDWLYVEDHNAAVWTIMQHGKLGEKYNIGGDNEWTNIRLVRELCRIYADFEGLPKEEIESLITFVKDRPGHDRRFAIDCSKLKIKLGWHQVFSFSDGLAQTVKWYLQNSEWVALVKNGDYRKWIEVNYTAR